MSTPDDDEIYAGAPLDETDWLRIIRDTPMPPANPYDQPATKSQKSYIWDLGLRDQLKIDSLSKSQASALISAAIECRDEKDFVNYPDDHGSNKKSGCLSKRNQLVFIALAFGFMLITFTSFCSGPRSAPVAASPLPTATPDAAPDAEPTPAPTPEPISFRSGQQIITLEPVTLIGAQGSVTMPAGSRLTIESTTADTVILHRGEFRATVPFSAIKTAE